MVYVRCSGARPCRRRSSYGTGVRDRGTDRAGVAPSPVEPPPAVRRAPFLGCHAGRALEAANSGECRSIRDLLRDADRALNAPTLDRPRLRGACHSERGPEHGHGPERGQDRAPLHRVHAAGYRPTRIIVDDAPAAEPDPRPSVSGCGCPTPAPGGTSSPRSSSRRCEGSAWCGRRGSGDLHGAQLS